MPDLKKISDEAGVIDNGFALKKLDNTYSVFNLNNGYGAAVRLVSEAFRKVLSLNPVIWENRGGDKIEERLSCLCHKGWPTCR